MVQAPARGRLERLGRLPDDGADLGGGQSLAHERAEGAACHGLGDDEGRVAVLDVVDPLKAGVIDEGRA